MLMTVALRCCPDSTPSARSAPSAGRSTRGRWSRARRTGGLPAVALVTIAKARLTKEARDGLASVTPEELAAHRGGLVAMLTAGDPPGSR